MKRFWKTASALPPGAEEDQTTGWRVGLDGRPVKTPDRRMLAVPTKALADAIVQEWDGAPEEVDVRAMPMTQLATTVVDRVTGQRDVLQKALAAFGETDLLCYRATSPDTLVARQAKQWDPLLLWARERHGAALEATAGIMAVTQPEEATARLANAIATLDDWRFGAVQVAIPLFGSLVLGLAFVERFVDAEAAFQAANLEEIFQAEHWGADAEAVARREALLIETQSLARFLDLIEGATE